MPLDPALQTYLDAAATLDLPPLRDQPLDELRENVIVFAEAGAGPAQPVAHVEDRELDTKAGPLWARSYAPSTDTDPLPVIAYLHGGGWVFMGIDTHGPGLPTTRRTQPARSSSASTTTWRPSTASRPRSTTAMRPSPGWPRTPPTSAATRVASPWRVTAPAGTSPPP